MANERAAKRKAHKKSHLGCVECKRRRIKCDETHPTCVACTTRGTTCSYNSFNIVQVSRFVNKTIKDKPTVHSTSPTTLVTSQASPSTSQASPADSANDIDDATFRPESLDDLRLLHHWSRHAARSMTELSDLDVVFQDRIVEEGLKQPFLLHGALALSALHAEYTGCPPGPTPWRALAASHYATALRLYRSALADISDDKCSALFMFAILAALTALAMADKSPEHVVTDLLESCRMWIGIVSVSHHVIEVVRTGPFSRMTGRHVGVQAEEVPGYAQRVIQNLTERAREVPEEDKTGYVKVIEGLNRLFHYKSLGPLEVLRWLCQFETSSLDVLKKRADWGDAVLAIMGAIIHELDGYWWARGFGEALARAVIPSLGPQWSELKILVVQIIDVPLPELRREVEL
ncbi:Fungal specific transcription factor domain-containing protein 72 [Elsinoe fawcettii]|nr:Fungal specific transcription factor domain-containing protein 72 [Elsinoe fawcettii]